MINKISKHKSYDDPTAFSRARNFAQIKEVTDGRLSGGMEAMGVTRYFQMGKIKVSLHEPDARAPYFMSVHGKDTYPSWDEIVWLRYNLIPDAARMALILPNLNNYINEEGTLYKYVFTMEQQGWALDPIPHCPSCDNPMTQGNWQGLDASSFVCESCEHIETIDFKTWNEQHGNGFLGTRP